MTSGKKAQQKSEVNAEQHASQLSHLCVPMPMVREQAGTGITRPADVGRVLDDLRTMSREVFAVLTLNTKNKLIDRHVAAVGTLDSCMVHPRDVFRQAIIDNASAVIVSHNHPSGDPSPSAEDVRLTRQLVEAGRILGIRVLDHIVLGSGECQAPHVSLREAGLVSFDA